MIHFKQAQRGDLFISSHHGGVVARKRARIVAIKITEDFTVDTDRGVMAGHAGDWLVTNHPADDPGSDMWTISDERFQSTYIVDEARARSMEPTEPDYGNKTTRYDETKPNRGGRL